MLEKYSGTERRGFVFFTLGASPLGALWRAVGVFCVAYVFPRVLVGQAVSVLQWPAIFLSIALMTVAIHRLQALRDSKGDFSESEPELLTDASAQAGAFDEVEVGQTTQPLLRPRKWSEELLHALEWRRMADVCQAFYQQKGLLVKELGVEVDGTVSALLYQSTHEEGTDLPAFALLYSRSRGGAEIGLAAIQDVQAKMQTAGVGQAFFMGAWGFDGEARQAAKDLKITLVDDRLFLSMINRLSVDEQEHLLMLALDGDYFTPSCPACGLKMLARQNSQGRYWGCRAFPRCKSTLGMRV